MLAREKWVPAFQRCRAQEAHQQIGNLEEKDCYGVCICWGKMRWFPGFNVDFLVLNKYKWVYGLAHELLVCIKLLPCHIHILSQSSTVSLRIWTSHLQHSKYYILSQTCRGQRLGDSGMIMICQIMRLNCVKRCEMRIFAKNRDIMGHMVHLNRRNQSVDLVVVDPLRPMFPHVSPASTQGDAK